MHRFALSWGLVVLASSGCSPTASATDSATGSTSSTGATTGVSTEGGTSTGGSPTTGDTSTGDASTGGASTGDASTEGGSTGGGGSTSGGTGTTTGDASTGSSGGSGTGGGVVVSFTCVETTPVELYLKEAISGSFTAEGTPVDLTATMVKGGAIDFHVDTALPVDPNDPYAADVAAFEMWLTMTGWDVNPADDMSGDRRYFFAPQGAQNVAIFQAFYYKVYGGGGNGQFEFDCALQ